MLSVKRLLYVILLVITVSSVFMIYNINEEKTKKIEIYNKAVEEEPLSKEISISKENEPKFLITGSNSKEIYKEIYRNTCLIMSDLKLSYEEKNKIETKDLNKNTVLIFCDDVVSKYIDLKTLGQFIIDGGKAIFAGGLAEGNEESYLYPFLGIKEKTIKENYNKLSFVKELFPIQYEEMNYDGYNASTWLSIKSDAEVYVEDANKKVPILYSYGYEKGKSFLINGIFMADINCSGILTGAIGAIMDDFIYPIVGGTSVFLDNFPMVTYINDKISMKLYGRNTEAFVRDTVWPVFLGISLRENIPYTSSVLIESSKDKSFPVINDSLFSTIGKSALQYQGELVYGSNCEDENKIFLNKDFLESFNEVFPRYDVNGLVMMSDKLSESIINIPDVKIKNIRGHLGSSESNRRFNSSSSYSVFPAATFGNTLEEGNLLEITSVIASYGMISHVFDINTLIAEDENIPSWDRYKKQIGLFEEKVLKPASYLEGKTLSQMRSKVKSYVNMEFGWRKEGNRIEIECSKFINGQTFFYKTNGEIESAEGLSFKRIDNGYYLLKLANEHAVIELKER
ncbi:DUF2194 domain-containing protein [Clostridium tunisiense]|uniref:DUF2194 domain-containing protein n=1 Tax=Clostridium tunisiense TaxID=219748 RepID=UPI0002F78ABF|nr:DUF2194 domain-containing protein [Clostridium tunisiense]